MYSEAEAIKIKASVCQRIAEGKSLRAICGAKDMPDQSTIYQWLSEDHEFSKQYASARETQADFYADEIIDIADAAEDPQKARVQIDARKWKASKMQPKKYGDRLDLNHSGTIETMSEDQLNARLAELLRKTGVGEPAGGSGSADEDEQA